MNLFVLLQMIVWTVQNIQVSIHVWDNLRLNVNNTDNTDNLTFFVIIVVINRKLDNNSY